MASILDLAKNPFAQTGNVNVTPAFLDAPLVEYQPVDATSSMSGVPRFGHPRNFSALFVKDDPEASEEYLKGLLFVGAFVLALFLTWGLVLVIFKLADTCRCYKRRRPGILSGRPFTLNDDDEPTKDQLKKWESRSNTSRLIFLFFGFLLVMFSIVMILSGFQQVKQTRIIAEKSLDDASALVVDAAELAEDLKDVGLSAIDLRDQLVVELDKDKLCPNDPNYLAQGEITRTIEENAGAAIEMLEMLGEFATKDIKQMEAGLLMADEVIDDIDTVIYAVKVREGAGIVFIVPLVVMTVVMMVGAECARRGKQTEWFEFAMSWILLPMFIVWIVATFTLCGLLALAASANADFCAGGADMSPDSTILAALQNAGLKQDSIEFEIARYYLHQCTAESQVDPFLFLRRHQAEIVSCPLRFQFLQMADILT